MNMFLRQAVVIARRDFIATVFTPAFLIFLLAPLFMLVFATVGGTGARMIADSGEAGQRIVVIASAEENAMIGAADGRRRDLIPAPIAPPQLETREPRGDPEAQARAVFSESGIDVTAVLYRDGTGEDAGWHIIDGGNASFSANYLAALAEDARRDRLADISPGADPPAIPRTPFQRQEASSSDRQSAGMGALFVLFLLTLLLAGQTVSVLAEEKGNKVIEILAAAAPLEAVFVGKLAGLFGVALLFVAFWGGLASMAIGALAGPGMMGVIDPAIGLSTFLTLGIVYFAMGYLLLGSVFLAVGAQASSMREIQMLSLPITFFQMAMFGLASAAAATPGSTLALIAELFPFSSPFAMVARGATDAALWPHLAAIAWQLLWVAITIAIGARWFRKGVLKSGPSLLRRFNPFRNSTKQN